MTDDTDDTVYVLTPFGCMDHALRHIVPDAGAVARVAIDALELHMRRHYATQGACAAIILDDGNLIFGSVHASKPEDA